MKVDVWNHSIYSIKEEDIIFWTQEVFKVLATKQVKIPASIYYVTIVFKNIEDVQALNRQFRQKDRPTDVLSFEAIEPSCLGEIVLATEVIWKQACQNQHSFFYEAGYLILHGILHLLGYEHERGGEKAKKMMELQDTAFEQLKRICGDRVWNRPSKKDFDID